jgi:flavin reductase (DIM6/NTAB) family NADH-FMN oxidoreductase RutF
MGCEVESSQDIKGYRLFIGRVVDQHDTGNPPLIWQRDKFFGLKPI